MPRKKRAPAPRTHVPPRIRNRNAVQTARVYANADAALDLRIKGMSVRAIAAELGLPPTTVHESIHRGLELTVEAMRGPAEQWRAMETERLERATAEAQKVVETTRSDELRLKALDVIRKNSESLRKLHGLDAPTRIDATVEHKAAPMEQMTALLDTITARLSGRPATTSDEPAGASIEAGATGGQGQIPASVEGHKTT